MKIKGLMLTLIVLGLYDQLAFSKTYIKNDTSVNIEVIYRNSSVCWGPKYKNYTFVCDHFNLQKSEVRPINIKTNTINKNNGEIIILYAETEYKLDNPEDHVSYHFGIIPDSNTFGFWKEQ